MTVFLPVSYLPYAVGMRKGDIVQGPLAMFQAAEATQEETLKLLLSINENSSTSPRPRNDVEKVFEKFWLDLELEIKQSNEQIKHKEPKKEKDSSEISRELLEKVNEVLENTRTILRGDMSLDSKGWLLYSESEGAGKTIRPTRGLKTEEQMKLLSEISLNKEIISRISPNYVDAIKFMNYKFSNEFIILEFNAHFSKELLVKFSEELINVIKKIKRDIYILASFDKLRIISTGSVIESII